MSKLGILGYLTFNKILPVPYSKLGIHKSDIGFENFLAPIPKYANMGILGQKVSTV